MSIWELDFYSRPILDDNGKKVWELLVCTPDRSLEYAQHCPAGQVNAAWLKAQLSELLSTASDPPQRIRYFRKGMASIISRACTDLGLPLVPSRRTFALSHWIQEREREVYPQHPNYQLPGLPPVAMDQAKPQSLPDALLGQQWAYVTLRAGDLEEWPTDFGEQFDLSPLGLDPDTIVPGIAIFSPRAMALAAWMSGLEPAFVAFDGGQRPGWVLETGTDERWLLSAVRDEGGLGEGKAFEEAKKRAQNVHFIAVQVNPNQEQLAGFWLLQETDL
ncbi:Tab2/Atab2 family RNA-binding protein [Leptolyngbya sp. FACHB-261]|uniref:Tab2/Atab2 family RNA-binding protein n=1 Tax=Leptolyngbya sp. FACHB-261 TaxID=2692806 RepID=UPI001683CDC4|nr:Tab2/Atab2 family RNA-binding protein [Leptolyngbya sp. FACHB-261]MBD2104162.1 Tab2/Atab2 family RNA-binding protein [Leptolyngbya sp. FACHB-261]